ncbi:hypothetical protein PPGU19_062680 (plasmid) [Paraburkholderia sp. PGU19]|nr:hypothetical protein PPGU19_062680 [Paraburkholderia sp. PGU19]
MCRMAPGRPRKQRRVRLDTPVSHRGDADNACGSRGVVFCMQELLYGVPCFMVTVPKVKAIPDFWCVFRPTVQLGRSANFLAIQKGLVSERRLGVHANPPGSPGAWQFRLRSCARRGTDENATPRTPIRPYGNDATCRVQKGRRRGARVFRNTFLPGTFRRREKSTRTYAQRVRRVVWAVRNMKGWILGLSDPSFQDID